ncbi:MAG: response regulator transcription factor [Deltaproteobacteria bacterium]|nr:response regulator transcription factor [Deltaproteobacteria bacterium]MCW5806789.1 response regulator transcription factor [Deltaproteobacteria bacterium]
MASVLVVDDDAHIREVARFALARAGHTVELANDGAIALDRMARGGVDLVVLDVLMPELDGFAVCRRLRADRTVPIVFLSSRGEEADRVLGLDLGADDYLAKPFSPRELVARVAAVLRRTGELARRVEAHPLLELGAVAIDRDRHEVRVAGEPLQVTATELRLIATLATHRGRVLSRGQLIATVYGDDHHISERTIDTHVRNLRAKLAARGADVIETIHGVGYRCG